VYDVDVKSSRSLSHLLMSFLLVELFWPRPPYARITTHNLSIRNGTDLLKLECFSIVSPENETSCALTFTFAICRLPSVCLSVTFVHPTQAIENLFLSHLVRWPFTDIQIKFYGANPRGTPPSRELNTRV